MTTDAPLFSIITVTKDNLEGLQKTAASLRQSFTGYEWIVIDGNSKDGTREYLSGTSAKWLSEPDKGIYDAMNKGIERSTGRYLLFLNAGDRLSDPDILSTLSKAIAADNPDFIYGDALESSFFYKKARPPHMINSGMITHHQAMLYARDALGSLRYDTGYKIAADYDFTLRFLKNRRNIHYCPAALCIFEEGGISQQNTQQGRYEENLIRQNNGINLLRRMIVTLRQTAAAAIKRASPSFYRRLR